MNKRTKKISLIILVLLVLIVVTVGFIFISNVLSKNVNASTYNESLSVEKGKIVTSEVKSRSTKAVAVNDENDNEVYVVFSFAGGTGGTKKVFATYGKDMPSSLTPPTKENYEFLGYFDDDNNEKQYYDANMNSTSICDVEDTLILTAHWAGQEITITLDHNGGTSNMSSITIESGAFFESVEIPTRKGYSFEGYKDGDKLVFNKNGAPAIATCTYTSSVTLTADWNLENYQIKFELENPDVNGTVTASSLNIPSLYDITLVEKNAYNFEGVVKGDYRLNLSPNKIAKGQTGDITVYGKWVSADTTITYSLDGGKNNSANITLIKKGQTLNLEPATKTHYIFDSWYLNDKRVSSVVGTGEESITLVAKWKNRVPSQTYTLDANMQNFTCSGYQALVLKLPSRNFYSPCVITVPQGTRYLQLFADKYIEYDLYIVISSRTTDFDLYLDDIGFCGPATGTGVAHSAIKMTTTNDSVLNLYTYGKVCIQGGTPPKRTTSGYGYNGANAIECSTLHIRHAENLTIKGGSGSYGSYGYGTAGYAVYVQNKFYRPAAGVTLIGGTSGSTQVAGCNMEAEIKEQEY